MRLDPEFDTYTYGDPTGKRFDLMKLQKNDLLLVKNVKNNSCCAKIIGKYV